MMRGFSILLVSLYLCVVWTVMGLQHRIPKSVLTRKSRTDHYLLASTSYRDESYLRTDILRRGSTQSSVQPEIDLPALTGSELEALSRGERVQKQERSGSHGDGLVVVDVRAPADTIFKALANFENYQSMIPTVRNVDVLSITEKSGTEAEFSLSKFRLKVNVLHTIHEKERIIKFRLNPERSNPVFSDAQGFWHVAKPEERPDGYSRVYLSASIVASRLLPPFILDYASARALPRASMWIQPFFAEKTGGIEWS